MVKSTEETETTGSMEKTTERKKRNTAILLFVESKKDFFFVFLFLCYPASLMVAHGTPGAVFGEERKNPGVRFVRETRGERGRRLLMMRERETGEKAYRASGHKNGQKLSIRPGCTYT